MAPSSSRSQTTVVSSMSQVEVTEKTEGVEKDTAVEARTSGVQAEGFDYNYKHRVHNFSVYVDSILNATILCPYT